MDERHAQQLHERIRTRYGDVAAGAEGHFAYPVGRSSAVGLGYEPAWLVGVPGEVVDRFVGVGNPWRVHAPVPGDAVLDLGCGAGCDVFVAANLVGPQGQAVGIDLSSEMLTWARRAAGAWEGAAVSFVEGLVEDLPFDEASFDVVVSNGVLNLLPDKDRGFREIHRVLKPGGTLAAADLVVVGSVPEAVLADAGAWST